MQHCPQIGDSKSPNQSTANRTLEHHTFSTIRMAEEEWNVLLCNMILLFFRVAQEPSLEYVKEVYRRSSI
jgi:hypothetical protein